MLADFQLTVLVLVLSNLLADSDVDRLQGQDEVIRADNLIAMQTYSDTILNMESWPNPSMSFLKVYKRNACNLKSLCWDLESGVRLEEPLDSSIVYTFALKI